MLDDEATNAAFEEFERVFVPGHMSKRFLKVFGVPKMAFGNRYFKDDAAYRTWDTRLQSLVPGDLTHVEVTVIYGSPDSLEAHRIRGETRRTLKDIFIDDWVAACAIVKAGPVTLYMFAEPKMKGAIVLSERPDVAPEPEPDLS